MCGEGEGAGIWPFHVDWGDATVRSVVVVTDIFHHQCVSQEGCWIDSMLVSTHVL